MRPAKLFQLMMVGCLVCCLGLATNALALRKAKIWDGKHWQEMNAQAKVTYIAGICNMADFVAVTGGTDRATCISRCFVDELKNKTLAQVVEEVDTFYKNNPDKLDHDIIEIILRRCTKICPPQPPTPEKKK